MADTGANAKTEAEAKAKASAEAKKTEEAKSTNDVKMADLTSLNGLADGTVVGVSSVADLQKLARLTNAVKKLQI